MLLLPVVAVILGWAVLREPITVPMAAGMLLVLLGVALAQRRAPSAVPTVVQLRSSPDRRPRAPFRAVWLVVTVLLIVQIRRGRLTRGLDGLLVRVGC